MEQALTIDAKNGVTLWADAISKELENARVAFEVLSGGKKHFWVTSLCDAIMVFNFKMEDFRQRPGL